MKDIKNRPNKTNAVDRNKARKKGLDVREPQPAQQLATKAPSKKKIGVRGPQRAGQFVTKDEFAELKLLIIQQGSEMREAIAKQNTAIAKQNTTIAKQNTAIAELGGETREAIAKQNTIIAKQGGETMEAIAKQGGETMKAIAEQGGEIKALHMNMKILLWGIPLLIGVATSIITFVFVIQ